MRSSGLSRTSLIPASTSFVADDGPGLATKAVVERWRAVFRGRLDHVWQSDEGFRAGRARNLGALAASPWAPRLP